MCGDQYSMVAVLSLDGQCKGTTRSPCTTTFILITSYFSAIISNLPRRLSSSRDLSQTIATIADHRRRPHSLAQPRTASHSIAWLCHSGLPNMGGLILYMVTCIYTLRA